ncbi:MAG TPA: alpha/beta hydrolase [Candidatus Methylomirabilis sp.]|nr:alpha/beta hydrolase [Candidatus Methylomirabilis sp.]
MTTRSLGSSGTDGRSVARAASLALALFTTACSTGAVGVTQIDSREVHQRLTQSALSSGKPSTYTENVLLEAGLVDLFDKNPEKALEQLHDLAVSGSGGPNELFAVAEASFLYSERSGSTSHYLATAVYAWAYLFPEDATEAPSPFDPRFRLAANLYNRALTAALKSPEANQISPHGGTLTLPFGELDVTFDADQMLWHGRRMTQFAPMAEFKVFGLPTHYREAGIGAPLAASIAPLREESNPDDLLRPELVVPVTALLRLPRSRTGLAWPPYEGSLELHVPDASETVEIAGQQVPLEIEPTAVLAYSLNNSPIWNEEYRRFFEALQFGSDKQSELFAMVPHRRGRIPVVFVHGTASSFGRWSEMYNRLAADPRLRAHYEFWFFSYDSGSPIGWSAMLLRESLQRAVTLLDPNGTDPGLHRMVVIGHSQGGLLTKMTVIDSESRFWDLYFRRPPESLDVSPATRDLLQRIAFVKPLPFVKRVVFLATPHRGSYLTLHTVVNWVAGFIKAPFTLARAMGDLVTRNREALALASAGSNPRLPTSLDEMNPRNRFLKTLSGIPLAPDVAAHSIIAVQGSGPVEDGADGVVAYRSAHLEGVDSELVVQSGHSLQDQAETIEEVRRILLYHLVAGDDH